MRIGHSVTSPASEVGLRCLSWLAAWALVTSIASASGEPPSYAAAFSRAFEPGFTVREDGELLSFQVLELGQLALPSGHLVACDFLVFPKQPAFAVQLPHGKFPVRLAVTRSKMLGERTVFARLDIKPSPDTHWTMALMPEQHPAAPAAAGGAVPALRSLRRSRRKAKQFQDSKRDHSMLRVVRPGRSLLGKHRDG